MHPLQILARASIRSLAAIAAIAVAACTSMPPASPTDASSSVDPRRDYHSYANTSEFRTTHLLLDLEVDFDEQVLSGSVELQLQRLSPTATEVVLDTRDLKIEGVDIAEGKGSWSSAEYEVGSRHPILGAPLAIHVAPETDRVRVRYSTVPEASGLQWLTPEQTAGKKQPFLFTQSQAIHARSWIPSQDTPQVRSTYEARIRTPKDLLAVMSAANTPDARRDGNYSFQMPQPTPSYLLALAVGDVKFKSMGPRTGIYAEPSMLKAAAAEFEDTEKMIDIVERLFGPYRWDRFDMIVLPPAFPYGGMENPRLTFLTPTAVVGDKSGVSLIAHELAHSWSGNLVTNATWRDFWLNEGTTTYLTYRIMDELYSQERGDMERLIGYQKWIESNEHVSEPGDRALVYDVSKRDPDEVFSSIPYQRGQSFFTFLESRVGRKAFDSFLRGWFDANAFKSRTTEDFLAYLDANLRAAHPGAISDADIDAWIFNPEMPSGIVEIKSDAFAKVDAQRDAWLAGKTSTSALKAASWSRHEWVHFLDNLPQDTSSGQLAQLDQRFKLTSERNAEIVTAWFRQAIRHGYKPALPAVEKFLLSVGRMKFLNPLYRELSATPEGLERARAIYEKAKSGYHPIARAGLERMLAEPKPDAS